MMHFYAVFVLLVGAVSAVNLYVSSYAGTITTLALNEDSEGDYSLAITSTTKGCGLDPSWLTLEPATGILYCSDEGVSDNHSVISSYDTSDNGTLTLIDSAPTLLGPVSSVLYGDGSAIVQAHYSGSAVSTYTIAGGRLTSLNNFTFTGPLGPDKTRQGASHPHEVILDPTRSFIVVPDLGSDLLRVFAINANHTLSARAPYAVTPGSGPRHGAFLRTNTTTWFFLVSELANTVATYRVSYTNSGLSFAEVFCSSTHGNATSTPATAAAAEVLVSPDGKFVYTSSRSDSLFRIPNFNPNNSTEIASDSLQSWAVDATTGKLKLLQISPSGGSGPRQFSLNEDGTLAAVGLQKDGTVVIIERDPVDGTFGDIVASADLGAIGVNTVIWDE